MSHDTPHHATASGGDASYDWAGVDSVTLPVVELVVAVVAGIVLAGGLVSGLRDRGDDQGVVCPVCGSENLAMQTYCRDCQADLGGRTELSTDAW